MGTDEHAYTEYYDGSRWRPVRERRPDPYWEEEDGEDCRMEVPQDEWLTNGRDYTAYGMLAGVRGDCPEPLALERGLPHDLSPELREMFDGDGGLHSRTWFTARELLEFDWGRTDTQTLYVSLHAYEQWAPYWYRHRQPENGTAPPGARAYEPRDGSVLITPEQAAKVLVAFRDNDAIAFDRWRRAEPGVVIPPAIWPLYVRIEHQATWAEQSGHLYCVGLPTMLSIARRLCVSNNNLRCVLAFDN